MIKIASRIFAMLKMILNFNRVQSQLINQPFHSIIRPWATYSPWLFDPIFKEHYDKMKMRTLVDEYRCFELWEIALQQQKVEGNFLEVGVWQGGTALLLGKSLENTDKKLYLADTFTGVVNASEVDSNYIGGEHADTSVDFVTDFLNSELHQNFELLVGEFPSATGDLVLGPLAFVHIDVDVYDSGKSILDWCRTRMSPNGVIVFDDYGFLSTDGITKLVNENFIDAAFLIV